MRKTPINRPYFDIGAIIGVCTRAPAPRRARRAISATIGRRRQMNGTRPGKFDRTPGRGATAAIRPRRGVDAAAGFTRFRQRRPFARRCRKPTRRSLIGLRDRRVRARSNSPIVRVRAGVDDATARRNAPARNAAGRTRRPARFHMADGVSGRRSRPAPGTRWHQAARRARRDRWGARERSSHRRTHPR